MNKIDGFIKKHPALSWVFGFQLFRFLLLPFMGLMPQDAYYHFYGQNLALSYFDHPGMIGYQLRLFTDVFGQSVFILKLSDFVITSLTIYSFYKLANYFLSKEKVNNALVLLISTLMVTILSINSTPDVPLLLFWTLSVICLYKAVFLQKNIFWLLAGITMGMAFNSKYTAILLQFGLLAFIVFSKEYRKLLFSPWLWLSLIISVVVMFPVWWWNYQNNFASFVFQGAERAGEMSGFSFSARNLFGGNLLQFFLVIPVLFFILVGFTFKYVKRVLLKFKLPSSKILFLLAFFIPTFVGFLILTPIYWVKMNWLMPSYITGVIVAGIFATKKQLKWQLRISVVLHLLLAVQILFYVFPVKSDDTWVGWKQLADETKKLQKEMPNTFVFSADKYKTSACLNFYFDERVYAQNIFGMPAKQFDYVGDDVLKLQGKNAIFINSDTRFKTDEKNGKIDPLLQKNFEKVIELKPIIVSINDRERRKFWVYYCENYQPNF